MKTRNLIVWTSMIVATLALTTGAASQARGQSANEDGVVAVGGVSILTIRIPAAGMSVKQRADAITTRLRFMLSDPDLKPSDIVASPLGDNAAEITVKGKLLVTIDSAMAKIDSTTPMKLAKSWTKHLRKVLPQLNVQPNPNDKKAQ
jgi:hypothetical protein